MADGIVKCRELLFSSLEEVSSATSTKRWREPFVPGGHRFQTLTADTASTSMVELWGYGV